MVRIGQRERDAIGKEIDVLADKIEAVGQLPGAHENRMERLQSLHNKLDSLRDQLFYVRGRT